MTLYLLEHLIRDSADVQIRSVKLLQVDAVSVRQGKRLYCIVNAKDVLDVTAVIATAAVEDRDGDVMPTVVIDRSTSVLRRRSKDDTTAELVLEPYSSRPPSTSLTTKYPPPSVEPRAKKIKPLVWIVFTYIAS